MTQAVLKITVQYIINWQMRWLLITLGDPTEGHFWLLQWWKIESSLKRWVGKLGLLDGYGEGFGWLQLTIASLIFLGLSICRGFQTEKDSLHSLTVSTMIHSLFLINSSGDIFLEKHWKSVVSRSVCDYFFEAQERATEAENVPPVIPTPHHYLLSVYRHKIFFVAVIQTEVPPLFVIEFLHRVVDTFQVRECEEVHPWTLWSVFVALFPWFSASVKELKGLPC